MGGLGFGRDGSLCLGNLPGIRVDPLQARGLRDLDEVLHGQVIRLNLGQRFRYWRGAGECFGCYRRWFAVARCGCRCGGRGCCNFSDGCLLLHGCSLKCFRRNGLRLTIRRRGFAAFATVTAFATFTSVAAITVTAATLTRLALLFSLLTGRSCLWLAFGRHQWRGFGV